MQSPTIDLNVSGSTQPLRSSVTSAVYFGICLQFVLLLSFLLFVNFHLLHPIQWLTSTLSDMCAIGTFFALIPLLAAVLGYNISLYGHLTTRKRYKATRFTTLALPLLPKLTFLSLHLLLSLIITWLYASYLPLDYRRLTFQCFGDRCLNGRYVFLVFMGLTAGFYHYAKSYACHQPEIEFPLIPQRRLVQLRYWLSTILRQSLWNTWLPTLCCTFIYALLKYRLNTQLAHWLRLQVDESMETMLSVFTDIRLLFYAWLLFAHILSNLQLLYRFYCITISDQLCLPISCASPYELTLARALANDKCPVLQKLAALQLYHIANDAARKRERAEIFALTQLGDHPYNWHHLSTQCFILLNSFTENLELQLKKISTIKRAVILDNSTLMQRPTPTEIAQRMLLRQHNEALGIRRMYTESNDTPLPIGSQPLTFQEKLPKLVEQTIRKIIYSVPCINYLFGKSEIAPTAFLLCNSQHIVWLVQGFAGLYAISIEEDQYGVVQSSLPDIFSALLKLKFQVDKLQNVNLHGKQLDRNLLTLKNAVKRSLYRMCGAFGDYLRDIITDVQELQQLQCFLNYQELN